VLHHNVRGVPVVTITTGSGKEVTVTASDPRVRRFKEQLLRRAKEKGNILSEEQATQQAINLEIANRQRFGQKGGKKRGYTQTGSLTAQRKALGLSKTEEGTQQLRQAQQAEQKQIIQQQKQAAAISFAEKLFQKQQQSQTLRAKQAILTETQLRQESRPSARTKNLQQRFKQASGTITSAVQPTQKGEQRAQTFEEAQKISLLRERPITERILQPLERAIETGRRKAPSLGFGRIIAEPALGVASGILGFGRTVTGILTIKKGKITAGPTTKGIQSFIKSPLKAGRQAVFSLGTEIQNKGPLFVAGEFAGFGLAAKGTAKAIKAAIPLRAETVTVATKQGTRTIRTAGIESGGRGQPVVTVVTRKYQTGRSLERISLAGRKARRPLELTQLKEAVPAPRTAVGTKALVSELKLSPLERVRIKSVIQTIRPLRKSKGLPVKEPIFRVKEFRRPRAVSRTVEQFTAERKGVFFGTTTAQQLPKGFRPRPGDIDIVFPSQTKVQLAGDVKVLAKSLKGLGEKVRVSAKNPLVIETTSGTKVIEFKTPGNLVSGESPAPVGALGFDFPNLRGGLVKTTVKFGKARAITAGEQLTRKGAAVTFIRPAARNAPVGFRGAGVFPKAARTKDIPTFIIQARGVIESRKVGVLSPLRAPGSARAAKSLDRFVRTFNLQQRLGIQREITGLGATDVKVPLSPSPTIGQVADVFRPVPNVPSRFFSPGVEDPLFVRQPRVRSPTLPRRQRSSPSPRILASPSPRILASPSPRIRSPSIFDSPSPSPGLSPSPRILASPSPRIRSPSIFDSPSPSPGLSPSISPSPFGFPKPRTPKIPRFRFPKVSRVLRQPRRPMQRREFKFTPSIVGRVEFLETGKKKKKPKIGSLTGLEVREVSL